MNITQQFYDSLAFHYDKLFQDWKASTREQALILEKFFSRCGFDRSSNILDCACGIGTQSVGLAGLGYRVTGSDISEAELTEAASRAYQNGVNIRFVRADFCALSDVFHEQFDIVICMDNALPHMLTHEDLDRAIKSISGQVARGGIFVASIRDYDQLLLEKPPYSLPYIHRNDLGQRVSFQTWSWKADNYELTQYIIDDHGTPEVHKFVCEYRATRREELSGLLISHGFDDVCWHFPEETGFYQPIVVAVKNR